MPCRKEAPQPSEMPAPLEVPEPRGVILRLPGPPGPEIAQPDLHPGLDIGPAGQMIQAAGQHPEGGGPGEVQGPPVAPPALGPGLEMQGPQLRVGEGHRLPAPAHGFQGVDALPALPRRQPPQFLQALPPPALEGPDHAELLAPHGLKPPLAPLPHRPGGHPQSGPGAELLQEGFIISGPHHHIGIQDKKEIIIRQPEPGKAEGQGGHHAGAGVPGPSPGAPEGENPGPGVGPCLDPLPGVIRGAVIHDEPQGGGHTLAGHRGQGISHDPGLIPGGGDDGVAGLRHGGRWPETFPAGSYDPHPAGEIRSPPPG